MKKKMILCLVLMLSVFLICGCSNPTNSSNGDNSKDKANTTVKEQSDSQSNDQAESNSKNKTDKQDKEQSNDQSKEKTDKKTDSNTESQSEQTAEKKAEENTISLAGTSWKIEEIDRVYTFEKEDADSNFKEKADKKTYKGHYTLIANKKGVKQYKEFYNGSSDTLKDLFKEKTKGMSGTEIGLSINTDEFESIYHEYYGIYTRSKIVIAEVGSECTVYVLKRK